MNLHNGGKPFYADITYSKGIFYKDGTIPEPTVKLDVEPLFPDVLKIEPDGPLPFKDNEIDSLVIDLPFGIAPKTAPSRMKIDHRQNIIINRFSSYYPVDELLESYNHWIQEAYRVLHDDGICVFKCQSNVSGGKQIWSEEYSWLCAIKAGFYVLDKFYLIAKSRLISGKHKNQQHARRFTSVYYVFKKKKDKTDYFKFLK